MSSLKDRIKDAAKFAEDTAKKATEVTKSAVKKAAPVIAAATVALTPSTAKADGVEKEFNKDGKLIRETTWKGNLKNGTETIYDENGNKVSQFFFVDGKKEFESQEYDSKGNVIRTTNWKNDQKNGVETDYTNGKKEVVYKDGKVVEGEADLSLTVKKEFHKNGTVARETSWKGDVQYGAERTYDENGNKLSESFYIDGRKEFESLDYKDGKVVRTTNWKNGLKDGMETDYVTGVQTMYKNGKVAQEESDLVLTTKKEFDENGNLARESTWNGNVQHGFDITYHANGNKASVSFLVDGRKEFESQEYDTDGNLIRTTNWKNGLKDGIETYYTDGKKQTMYEDGKVVENASEKQLNSTNEVTLGNISRIIEDKNKPKTVVSVDVAYKAEILKSKNSH